MTGGRRLAGVICGALALLVAGAPGAGAAKTKERPVRSAAPDAGQVKEYLVRVRDPLPAEFGEHPAACDWLSYLRWRHADGPRRSADADAVISLMPGFLSGASPFDQLARNTVRRAAKRGEHVEVWALDRRSNCLEDPTGVREAAKARDATVGWDYYWGNATVNGKRFGGFVSGEDAAWLESVGLDRTMRDWNAVNRAGLPSRKLRARKLICGGHSLGGPLTASYAGWDFDGDPATRRDAGYRQCAGFVGLDTRLRVDGLGGGGGFDPLALLLSLGEAGGAPYINTPPLAPETFQVPPLFGLAAWLHPDGHDALAELPRTLVIELAQKFLFSRDAVNFATGIPSIRDFTITNEVALAGVFDDNSAPLTFLRTSVGSLAGGPVVEKNFPFPDPTLALPGDTSASYTWETYDEVVDSRVPLNSEGVPFTSRESEVSDLRQLARTQFEAPANFIEQYFPVRILSDVGAAGDGDRSGTLANLAHDGIAKHPALLIQAGDSDSNEGDDGGRPQRGKPPNDVRGSREVILPGYNHVDVTAAAWRQNDGRPEPSSAALARFALAVAGD